MENGSDMYTLIYNGKHKILQDTSTKCSGNLRMLNTVDTITFTRLIIHYLQAHISLIAAICASRPREPSLHPKHKEGFVLWEEEHCLFIFKYQQYLALNKKRKACTFLHVVNMKLARSHETNESCSHTYLSQNRNMLFI